MDVAQQIMQNSKTIAVVGISIKEDRASFQVASYLKEQGYEVFPVNPAASQILGEPCYPTLSAIPHRIDAVVIFRRSEDVEPIVEEAITVGARAVWMQLGIVNHQAARRAEEAGLAVVMNRCMRVEHRKLQADR